MDVIFWYRVKSELSSVRHCIHAYTRQVTFYNPVVREQRDHRTKLQQIPKIFFLYFLRNNTSVNTKKKKLEVDLISIAFSSKAKKNQLNIKKNNQ